MAYVFLHILPELASHRRTFAEGLGTSEEMAERLVYSLALAGLATSALCWSHARRKFFELADIKGNARKRKPAHDISPVALEAVNRIDTIFDVERGISGLEAAARLEARQRLVRPLVDDLHDWMLAERDTMSRHNPVAKAIA